MLPEPTFALTIPSIHDGTVLDCRIYHPASLAANPKAPPWQRHAAVIAHPYAPMGGSYDDPLLDMVAAQLLRKGYLIGTFNFRGAGNSAGRTSWTAKPERDDYISFLGFMVYYIHHLDPFHHHARTISDPPHVQNTGESSPEHIVLPTHQPVLIMGGYSYGAMVTTKLPPLHDLLELFASPESGSDAAQIRLRAESLAEQQNLILRDARAAMVHYRSPSSPARHGVRIGGGEGSPGSRKSHESFCRRSFSLDAEEKLRKGVQEILAKTKSVRHGHKQAEKPKSPQVPAEGKLHPVEHLIMPKPAYILVSPLQGLVTHLATMSLVPSAMARHKTPEEDAAEAKLVQNPTLAVYGDDDVFVSAGKLRTWTGKMSSQQGSQFHGHEIESAGHFWSEEGVLYRMLDLVSEFAGKLFDGD